MEYFFLAVFVISSVVHLYGSYINDRKIRACSKGFILPGLLGWYCCCVPSVRGIVVAALVTSWLGDVLLIPKGTKWFAVGGVSFLASHVCFVLAYLPNVDFAAFSVWAAIAIAAVYFTAVCLVFRGLRPHLPKLLFYPMFLYLLINGTMNCCAFYQLLSAPGTATIVTFIGAMLFFASDSILFYVRFKKDTKLRSHFPVMLTYILAEFLIVLGFIMLA